MSNFNLNIDLSWREILFRVGLIVGTVVVIVSFLPHDKQANFKVEKGRPWVYGDLKAPFDFPIYKNEDVIQSERDSLMQLYEPLFLFQQRCGDTADTAIHEGLQRRHTRGV